MIPGSPAPCVRKFIDAENPLPPNQPNIFCAPCGNTTTARNNLAIKADVLAGFVCNILFMISKIISKP
jgi:hypothetical protein